MSVPTATFPYSHPHHRIERWSGNSFSWRGDRLPPVLLLVLYNGDQRWRVPVDLTAHLFRLMPPFRPLLRPVGLRSLPC